MTPEEELLSDLKMTKQVLIERGHTQGYLISHSGSVCMTGAAGVAVEGAKFIAWCSVDDRRATLGGNYAWSDRSKRLLEALSNEVPQVEYGRGLIHLIQRIVTHNDNSTRMPQAMEWVDRAIAKAQQVVDALSPESSPQVQAPKVEHVKAIKVKAATEKKKELA